MKAVSCVQNVSEEVDLGEIFRERKQKTPDLILKDLEPYSQQEDEGESSSYEFSSSSEDEEGFNKEEFLKKIQNREKIKFNLAEEISKKQSSFENKILMTESEKTNKVDNFKNLPQSCSSRKIQSKLPDTPLDLSFSSYESVDKKKYNKKLKLMIQKTDIKNEISLVENKKLRPPIQKKYYN